MIDKCYRCDEVISMCPCDESTYTADDEISRLRAELAECRAALMPFARIDLTTKEDPPDFAMLVLRARTALAAKGE